MLTKILGLLMFGFSLLAGNGAVLQQSFRLVGGTANDPSARPGPIAGSDTAPG